MIVPIIRALIEQNPFLEKEKVAIIDQFFGLTAVEEIAWLDFLNMNPNFFDELAEELRGLKKAVREGDTAYLENKLKELKESIQIIHKAEKAVATP